MIDLNKTLRHAWQVKSALVTGSTDVSNQQNVKPNYIRFKTADINQNTL